MTANADRPAVRLLQPQGNVVCCSVAPLLLLATTRTSLQRSPTNTHEVGILRLCTLLYPRRTGPGPPPAPRADAPTAVFVPATARVKGDWLPEVRSRFFSSICSDVPSATNTRSAVWPPHVSAPPCLVRGKPGTTEAATRRFRRPSASASSTFVFLVLRGEPASRAFIRRS